MPPKGSKLQESLLLVINIGVTCPGTQNNPSLLEKAKLIAQKIMEKKIFLSPKDDIGVILMGSSVTKNSLDTEHVGEFIDLQVPNWNAVEKIVHLQGTSYCSNWIEALSAAVEFMKEHAFSNTRKIVLMSDFNEQHDLVSQFDADEIAEQLTGNIQLIVIGEESLDEHPDSSLKVSEAFLKDLLSKINGRYLTYDNALADLGFYVRPPSQHGPWYCTLDLSDIKIPIVTYIKTTDTPKFPSWKVAKDGHGLTWKTEYMDRQRTSYDRDEIISGYKYGGIFVPIDKSLEDSMSYKSGEKSYKLHSFTHRNNIDLEYWCDTTSRIVLPSSRAKDAAQSFYSLVQAMHNKDMVAIVRKVYAAGRAPRMVALFPCTNVPDEPWCLVEVCTPFAEDRRVMESRPLKSVLKQLSKEQNEALDNLLDSLTLPDTEDSYVVEGSQYFLPGHVPNPAVQNRWNMLSYRALNPNKPLPPMEDYLKGLLEAPAVKERSKHSLQRVAELFRLENVDPKAKRKGEANEKDNAPEVKKFSIDETVEPDKAHTEHRSSNDPDSDASDVDLDELVTDI